MEQVNMVVKLILLIAFCMPYSQGNNTRDSIDGCKTAYTLGYGYKTMYHILEGGEHNDKNLTFKFYVKAYSDAHILLSSSENPTDSDTAYEIVIGAGRNTFSVIRSHQRQYTRAHVTTPNILSSSEYRGFWITLNSSGHLEVGKGNEQAPFLFWDDPRPSAIHFFGFCNWATVVGQWAYSCPREAQSEEISENLTTLQKLRKDLFTNYDPYSRPVRKITDITTVYLQIENRALRIDEKQSQMSISAHVYLQWQDQKLQWDPYLYENISQITIAYSEIWQPDIILYNAVGSGSGFFAAEPMVLTPIGSVKWKTYIDVAVHCKLDLSEWPSDIQICDLQLGYWAEHQYLQLLFSNEPENNSQQAVSEWEIMDLSYLNVHIKTPWTEISEVPKEAALVVRYTLQRKNDMYRAIFGVPLLVISITTLLPFWISPHNSNKLNISCLSVIIMGIFLVCLAKTLPTPADHIPSLVRTYSQGMVAVTFSILVSVAVIAISRNNNIQPLPSCIQKLLNMKYLQLLLLLPPALDNQDPSSYGKLNDDGSNTSTTNTHITASEKIQYQWTLLGLFIDRMSFFIYIIYLGIVFLGQI